ncbi:MAG: hypothetical protein DRO09_00165 [Thermoprotei archaeon]|nr:MAG: hypothetical protein DRO09_00165 [Thermoprotei archaeon]
MSFQIELVPVAKVDENIYLYYPKSSEVHGYYKVLYVEPLPLISHNFGSLDAKGVLTDQEVKALYVPDGWLAHYRILPREDVTVKVKQPGGQARWITKTGVAVLSLLGLGRKISEYAQLAEIFIYGDQTVKFEVVNNTYYPLPRCIVDFVGFRYKLEKLPTKPDKFTFVPLQGE